MLEPLNRGWGFKAPLIDSNRWLNQRESFFFFFFFPLTRCPSEQQWRACHGFIKYSLSGTTHQTLSTRTQAIQKKHNKSVRAQISIQNVEQNPRNQSFTSFRCCFNYWTVSQNGFHSSRGLIIRVRIILIIHSQLIGSFFFLPLSLSSPFKMHFSFSFSWCPLCLCHRIFNNNHY